MTCFWLHKYFWKLVRDPGHINICPAIVGHLPVTQGTMNTLVILTLSLINYHLGPAFIPLITDCLHIDNILNYLDSHKKYIHHAPTTFLVHACAKTNLFHLSCANPHV